MPTDSALGVVFPPDCPAGSHAPGVALHPTQLYSSAFGLVLAAALIALDRRRAFTGYLFAILCVLYGAGRFAIDLVRYYDPSSRLWNALSVSQAASLLVVASGILLLFILPRRRARRD